MICQNVFGQDGQNYESSSIGDLKSSNWSYFLKTGSNLFKGDINDNGISLDFNNVRFRGSLGLGYRLSSNLNINFEATYGLIKGKSTDLEMSFKGNIIETTGIFKLNVSSFLNDVFSPKYSFEIFSGFGLGLHKSIKSIYKLSHPSTVIDDVNSDKFGTAILFPIGAEVTYHASPNIDFTFEYRHTLTNTDNIDLVESGSNDRYASLNFGVTYKFASPVVQKEIKKISRDEGPIVDWRVRCIPEILEKENDSVPYELIIDLPLEYFDNVISLDLQPVLYSHINKAYKFDPIYIDKSQIKKLEHYLTPEGIQIRSSGSFYYEDDMKLSELVVIPKVYEYKKGKLLENDERPARKVADGIRTIKDRFMIPKEFLSVNIDKPGVDPLVINFIRNSEKLRYDEEFPDEESILKAIKHRIEDRNEKNVKFSITSYASPEGQEQANMKLSERRSAKVLSLLAKVQGIQYKVQILASTKEISYFDKKFDLVPNLSSYKHNGLFKYTSGVFKNYQNALDHCNSVKKLGFSDAFVAVFSNGTDNEVEMRVENASLKTDKIDRVINKGADWEGLNRRILNGNSEIVNDLRARLYGKNLEERQVILNLYYKHQNVKLDSEILNDLRKAEIQFHYDSAYQDAEKDTILLSNLANLKETQNLSEQELLYLSANTNNDTVSFEILRNLLKRFPQNELARINLAALLANKRNYHEAGEILDQIAYSGYGEYWYNKALLAAINKDYITATIYFSEAQKAGLEGFELQRTLNFITGNYDIEQIRNEQQMLGYNLALVLFIHTEYQKSEEVLNLSEIDSEGNVYYLKAVIAARLNNKEKALLNLQKAILQNDDRKYEAMRDVEFLQLRTEREFMKLLK